MACGPKSKHYTYKESSGTSGLARHSSDKHPALYQAVEAKLRAVVDTLQAKGAGNFSGSNAEGKTLVDFFPSTTRSQVEAGYHFGVRTWSKDDNRQKMWIERQVLAMAKSYNPLAQVEDPYFVDHWLRCVPELKIPSRRDFRLIHIPAMYQKTLDLYVKPELAAAEVYALTYDLWMTYGTTNVFAVNAHILANTANCWQRKILLLGLVRVGSGDGSTSGNDISKTLAVLIKRLSKLGVNLGGRYIGCNTDGGKNLEVLRSDAAGLKCDQFPSLTVRFAELCGMHLLGGAIKAGLSKEKQDGEANQIFFDELHRRVVSALAWPRKAEKPRRVWDERAIAHNLVPKLPLSSSDETDFSN